MFDLLVRWRHGPFGRILMLFRRLTVAVVVAAVVIVVVIVIIVIVVVAVVMIAVEPPLLIVVVVLGAVVVLPRLVVVLPVVVAWTLLLLLAVAALLPLEVGGRLFFTERFQLDGLHVVQFICVSGIILRLFLAGFRADFLVDFGFELEAAFQSAATA